MNRLEIRNLFVRVSRLASRVRRPRPDAPASCLSPFTLHPSPFTIRLSPQRGFTLIEVNLAIFIMAVGLLAMVAIYPLAYRENRQSKDDVKAAAAADCILNVLTAALSSRNITWQDWQTGIENAFGKTNKEDDQRGGWLAYCEWKGSGEDTAPHPKSKATINGLAQAVFGELARINKENAPSWPLMADDKNDPLVCAIVAKWGKLPVFDGDNAAEPMNDYSRVAIGVRVARRVGDLLNQPLFYTEIHFQGDQKELKE